MSWKTLIDAMVQLPMKDDVVGGSRHEHPLKDVLEAEPAIYWYPGSGHDLVPLVLDMPRNPTGRRLFPHLGSHQAKPLLLWMNDYNDCSTGFHDQGEHPVDLGGARPIVRIEGEPGRFCIPIPAQSAGDMSAATIPLTVFKARVMNAKPRRRPRHVRPLGGDLCTVFYSAVESEMLLRTIFAPHRIRVEIVALVKQGGFSNQRADFSQYKDIPRLLTEFTRDVGPVQAYLVDNNVKIRDYHSLERLWQPAWGFCGTRMWVPNKDMIYLARGGCSSRSGAAGA
jgi:hypothetical protein